MKKERDRSKKKSKWSKRKDLNKFIRENKKWLKSRELWKQ